jgi:hypothetical protein
VATSRIALFLAGSLVIVSLLLPPTYADLEKEKQALLQLHRRAREAHLKGDAALLAADASDFLELSGGEMHQVTRDQLRDMFTRVFQTRQYHTWDDVTPPVVHISKDGKMAWMAVHIKATLTMLQPQKRERAFQSSWIATYEKRSDGWKMVAISSSVADLEPPTSD